MRQFKYHILQQFALVFSLCLFFPAVSLAQRVQKSGSVFWRIESPTGSNTSYILGTIHFFGRQWLDKFPVIREKIKCADLFFSESVDNGEAENTLLSWFDSTISARKFSDFFGTNSNKVDSFFLTYGTKPQKLSTVIDNCTKLADQQMILGYYTAPLILAYRDELLELPARKGIEPGDFPLIDELVTCYADSLKLPMHSLDHPLYMKTHVADKGFLEESFVDIINNFIDLKTGNKNSNVDDDKVSYKLYNKGIFDFSIAYNQKKEEIDWETNVARNRSWAKQLVPQLKKKIVLLG